MAFFFLLSIILIFINACTVITMDLFVKSDDYRYYHSLARIIDTPEETLENVVEIFSEGEGCPGNNFSGLRLLANSGNPDVFRFVCRKCENIPTTELEFKLIRIIKKQFRRTNYYLQPNDSEAQIIRFCLEELNKIKTASSIVCESFQYQVGQLLQAGNIELAQCFVDTGFELFNAFPKSLASIRNNLLNTMRYLLKHGYDLSKDGTYFPDIMNRDGFTAEDFQLCFRSGLKHNSRYRKDFLEAALRQGRMDLAVVAYKYGSRLSREILCPDHISFICVFRILKISPVEFAGQLARNKCTDKVMFILAGASRGDTSSELSWLPRELILKELGQTLYSLEIAEEMELIFEEI